MAMQSAIADDQVSTLFRALADPGRLMILRHLETGEHNVRQLTEHMGLAQSTVSAHLSCLRECGLVHATPRGRSSVYTLTAPDALAALLTAANLLQIRTVPGQPHPVALTAVAGPVPS